MLNGTVVEEYVAIQHCLMHGFEVCLAVAIQCSNAVALKTMCAQCTSLITNYVHIKVGAHASVHSMCACVQLATGFEAGQKRLTGFETGQRL